MPKPDEREKLIEILKNIVHCTCLDDYKRRNLIDPTCAWCHHGDDIADFILEDRRRVVEPAKMALNIIRQHESNKVEAGIFWKEAREKWPIIRLAEVSMEQTLLNAGVE